MIPTGWFRAKPQPTPPEPPEATIERLLKEASLDFERLTADEIKVVTANLDRFTDQQLESMQIPEDKLRSQMQEVEHRLTDEGMWTFGRTVKAASLGILQTSAGGAAALFAGVTAPLPFALLGTAFALGFSLVNFRIFSNSYRQREYKALDEFLVKKVDPQLSIREEMLHRLEDETGRVADTSELQELSQGEARLKELREKVGNKKKKRRKKQRVGEPLAETQLSESKKAEKSRSRPSKKRRMALKRRKANQAEGAAGLMPQEVQPKKRVLEMPPVGLAKDNPVLPAAPSEPARQLPVFSVLEDENDIWEDASSVPNPVLDSDLLADGQTEGTQSQNVTTRLYRFLTDEKDTEGRPLVANWEEFKVAFSGIPDHVRKNYSEMVTAYSHFKKLHELQELVPGVEFRPVHFEPLYREGYLSDDPLQEVPPRVSNINDAKYLGFASVAACNDAHVRKSQTERVYEFYQVAEEVLHSEEYGVYEMPVSQVLASASPPLTTVPVENVSAVPVVAPVQNEPVVHKVGVQPLGFANFGSTCFANSSLKAIFGAYPETYFAPLRAKHFDDGDREEVRVAFLRLLDAYRGQIKPSQNAREELGQLFEACRAYGWKQARGHAFREIFRAGGSIPQSDAQEFIQPLLGVLELNMQPKCSVVVGNQLHFDLAEMGMGGDFWKPTVQKVNEQGEGLDHNGILQVQIPDVPGATIQTAVDQFLSSEELQDDERAVACSLAEAEATGYQVEEDARWLFDGRNKLPVTGKRLMLEADLKELKTLGIQLKLFEKRQGFLGFSGRKLTREGDQLFRNSDEFLEVPIKNTADGRRYKVRMKQKSLCYHGGACGGGHYTAALRSGDTWDHHDDTRVTSGYPTAKAADGSQAYIIFYEVDGKPVLID